MLFTHRAHIIGRLHTYIIFPEATHKYVYYNTSTLTWQGIFVRIRPDINSFEAWASQVGYSITVDRFPGLILSSVVDTAMKRMLAPITGCGYKDRIFDSIKRLARRCCLMYVCVINYSATLGSQ